MKEIPVPVQSSELSGGGGVRVYVSPTAKVLRRRDLGLKSHPKD